MKPPRYHPPFRVEVRKVVKDLEVCQRIPAPAGDKRYFVRIAGTEEPLPNSEGSKYSLAVHWARQQRKETLPDTNKSTIGPL